MVKDIPIISIVIINYNGRRFFRKLIQSISAQSFKHFEIIFVDNNSQDNSPLYFDMCVRRNNLKNITRRVLLHENVGFAKGNNIAVSCALGSYILFLNTDTTLDPHALYEMLLTLQKNTKLAGVAPKIYLSKFFPLKVFDSNGICMDTNGSPYNRGIGQFDLGQYDKSEEIMGLCFAACLVRKDIFLAIGGLDNTYFAYFEDVDWSFRVRKSGYSFISCPSAIVYHDHSGTSSAHLYAWKYNLIFRNYLRTVVKTFNKRNVIRILMQKYKDLFLIFIRRKSKDNNLRFAMMKVMVVFFLFDWYIYLLKRVFSKSYVNSEITDEQIFSLSTDETSDFFNPETYQPIVNLEMIDFIIKKKNYLHQNKRMISEWMMLKDSFYCSQYSSEWEELFLVFSKTYCSPYADDYSARLIYAQLKDMSFD